MPLEKTRAVYFMISAVVGVFLVYDAVLVSKNTDYHAGALNIKYMYFIISSICPFVVVVFWTLSRSPLHVTI